MKIMYHLSNNKFDKFSVARTGSFYGKVSKRFGPGVFLTKNLEQLKDWFPRIRGIDKKNGKRLTTYLYKVGVPHSVWIESEKLRKERGSDPWEDSEVFIPAKYVDQLKVYGARVIENPGDIGIVRDNWDDGKGGFNWDSFRNIAWGRGQVSKKPYEVPMINKLEYVNGRWVNVPYPKEDPFPYSNKEKEYRTQKSAEQRSREKWNRQKERIKKRLMREFFLSENN